MSVASSILNEFKETWPPSLYWLPFLNYCRSLALLLRYGGSTLPPGSAVQVLPGCARCAESHAALFGVLVAARGELERHSAGVTWVCGPTSGRCCTGCCFVGSSYVLSRPCASRHPLVQSAVVSVFITGLLAVFLGPYLSLVLPGIGENAGVPRSPLLCLSRYWNRRAKERLAAHGVGHPEGTFPTCI